MVEVNDAYVSYKYGRYKRIWLNMQDFARQNGWQDEHN